MSRNDALVVLGDCFKPTAMFGDMCEKVETFVDERHNEFFEDAELSIFKFIMRSGHPVFHVNQWVKALVEEC
ncbi:DNA helicase [Colletotrichum kahawae]|uniref:DNA helicase n=1 Tax=Colletotrichum kahawae TaxID=34407 RepID=A0AAD9Y4F4_COLKA|nr:DNA helicase [Colletotrichum kahawae]